MEPEYSYPEEKITQFFLEKRHCQMQIQKILEKKMIEILKKKWVTKCGLRKIFTWGRLTIWTSTSIHQTYVGPSHPS